MGEAMNKHRPPPTPTYLSGQPVPQSGTYRTRHDHPVIRELTILTLHAFPSCPKCNVPVEFKFLKGVPLETASARFRLLMNAR